MIPMKRQEAILELLKKNKTVSIAEIVAELNISEITARRDLDHLEGSSDHIMRIRGGAKWIEAASTSENMTAYLNDHFQEKFGKHQEEKAAIGKYAASLVENNQTVIIDAGTTAIQVAKHLNGKNNITAVVTAVNIAEELEGKEGVTTVLTGGLFRSKTTTLLSPFIEQTLLNIYADKVFIGITGVSLTHGMTCHDFLEADVKKILVKSGREIYWLADSSKLDFIGSIQISGFEEQFTIITDWGIEPEMKKELEKICKLIVVERG